jgi:hypothetical protein
MENDIVITFSNKRKLLLFFLNMGFIFLAFFLILVPKVLLYRLVGLTGLVVFGTMLVGTLFRVYFKKVALVITKEGLIDSSNVTSAAGLVKWDEICEIQQVEHNNSTLIKLILWQPTAFIDRQQSKILRFFLRSNYKIYGAPVVIPMIALNIYVDRLEQILKKGLEEHRNNNPA